MWLALLVLFVLTLLLLWCFSFYPLLCAVLARRKARRGTLPKSGNPLTPFVSVILPTFNEAAVVGARIDNLKNLDYPNDRYEIIVVDSQSPDGTTQIVEQQIARYGPQADPKLLLLQTGERQGKAVAINFALQRSRGEIIVIADANSIYEPSALTILTAHFADARVGAVGGRYLVRNVEETLPSLESIYWDVEHVKKMGESELDSASGVVGGLSAWRSDGLRFREDRLSEDLDACVTCRKNGLSVQYAPNALAYEPAATTIGEQIQQRRRVGQGILQVLVSNWRLFLLPHDRYSLIVWSHWTLSLVSPFLLIAVLTLYALIRDLTTIFAHLSLTAAAAIGSFFAVLLVTRNFDVKTQRPKKIGIRSFAEGVVYVLLNEYIILLAWSDAIFGRGSVLWEKAESTREGSK
jgi:poly-beta-1,6-N-acetyl-D-glucosamine synthase